MSVSKKGRNDEKNNDKKENRTEGGKNGWTKDRSVIIHEPYLETRRIYEFLETFYLIT